MHYKKKIVKKMIIAKKEKIQQVCWTMLLTNRAQVKPNNFQLVVKSTVIVASKR